MFKLPFITLAVMASAHVTMATPVEVSKLTQLTQLPSASGQCYYQNKLYAVGDDSPSVYQLNDDFSLHSQTSIDNGKPNKQGRIPGRSKADLEACDTINFNGKNALLMLGSGTRGDTREKALLFFPEHKAIQWINVKPLYRHLRTVAGLSKNEFINIEGLASESDIFYLFSRGSHGPNAIFQLNKSEFTRYLKGEVDNPAELNIGVQRVKLPDIQGQQATLSGATFDPISQHMLLTASVEDHEGGILGSVILTLPLDVLRIKADTETDLSQYGRPLYYQGKPLGSKVEAVSVLESRQGKIKAVLAADNDDGTSQFMHISLSL